ncbi:MAG: N-acetyltransferase [Spirochaetaceae bacterium]|jgi:predicted N-acetyltransferase YhbS|nr:N-acetyltransferase [Spirochaetaceae bacterium]
MDIKLRLEEEKDYSIVENITREAFWNVYRPGCDEHLVIHNMRNANEFIKELDYVAIYNNVIVGNIVYANAKIIGTVKEYDVLTFGPISVFPKYQKRGIGKKLIEHTIKKAKEMNFGAIIIYGNPKYYEKFGFKNTKEYGITDMEGNYNDALLVLELFPNILENINGKFFEGEVYKINEEELETFEKGFPYKEKLILDTQILKETLGNS